MKYKGQKSRITHTHKQIEKRHFFGFMCYDDDSINVITKHVAKTPKKKMKKKYGFESESECSCIINVTKKPKNQKNQNLIKRRDNLELLMFFEKNNEFFCLFVFLFS